MNYNTKVENDTTTSQCFSTSQQTLINMYVQTHHIPMPQQHQPHFPALSTPPLINMQHSPVHNISPCCCGHSGPAPVPNPKWGKKNMDSKALASNAGWALAGADGRWNPLSDSFSFSLLLILLD